MNENKGYHNVSVSSGTSRTTRKGSRYKDYRNIHFQLGFNFEHTKCSHLDISRTYLGRRIESYGCLWTYSIYKDGRTVELQETSMASWVRIGKGSLRDICVINFQIIDSTQLKILREMGWAMPDNEVQAKKVRSIFPHGQIGSAPHWTTGTPVSNSVPNLHMEAVVEPHN